MEQAVVLAVVVAYFALMIGIGYWANRMTKSAKEFLVAGQSLGFFVMAIATFSSIQSGWGMVGVTGTTYSWGMQAMIAGTFFIPVAFTLAWFLLGSRLYRAARSHNIYSVPDLIKVRYGNRGAHIAMSAAMFIGSIAYMTAQIAATGVIMSLLFGTSVALGTCIGSLVVAIYTIAGGMLAAVWTDLIQGLLMIAMSIAVFVIAINLSGGWSNTINTLAGSNQELVTVGGAQPATYILAFGILIIVGAAGQPQLVTKFLMLRDKKELCWGALVASVAYAITTLFALGIGLSLRFMTITGRAPKLSNLDNAAPYFLENFTHPVVAGLALTSLLAAIMSSASSFITIGASSLMRDLTAGLGIRVHRELLWGRVASAVVVLASLGVVLYLSQVIFLLGAIGWAAFAAAIVPSLTLGLYWDRASGHATTITVIFALAANIAITIATTQGWFTLPAYVHVGSMIVIASVILFIVVSILDRSTRRDRLAALYSPAPAVQAGGDVSVGASGELVRPTRPWRSI